MKLVVDNENGLYEPEEVTMTLGEIALKEIITDAVWEKNPWLRKFNTCVAEVKGKSMVLTFGNYLQPEGDEIS